jgi:quinol monooxygenase YgiN
MSKTQKVEVELYLYKVKIVIKENHLDEFIDCFNSLSAEFLKEKGYLGYSFCQEIGKENTFILIGEWKMRQDIEKHFKSKHFTVLIGAARVLGEDMDIIIGKSEKRGGFQLAKELMELKTAPI